MRVLNKLTAFIQQSFVHISYTFAGWLTPWTIRTALRRGLHAIYFKGDLASLQGSSLLAPTHHSWWDGYLVWLLGKKLKHPLYIMMDEAQLDALSFLRTQGVFGKKELRFALRKLRKGATITLFPEGEIRNPSDMHSIQQGLTFFSHKTSSAIYPLVIRSVMRGAEKPEIFIALGTKVTANDFLEAMHQLQAEVNADIAATHPETSPQGYVQWQKPPQRFDESLRRFTNLWRA